MGHKFEQTAMVFDVLCVEDKEIGIIIIYPRLSRLELSVLLMIANSIVIFFLVIKFPLVFINIYLKTNMSCFCCF